MKFLKPSFSKIQKEFLDAFIRYLNDEFEGGQVAMAERIGCDQSQISRWANKENAPPDFVCQLLLKELGGGSFQKTVGRRIRYLREKVFEVSPRQFTLAIKLDSVSQLEAVEQGETESPLHCIETLVKDYQVSASYLDYGKGGIFNEISPNALLLKAYLKVGFGIYVVTPPRKHLDRLGLKCRLVLHRHREHLPQCIVVSASGNFKHITGAGRLVLEDVLRAMFEVFYPKSYEAPPAMMADDKSWKDLQKSCFYRKEVRFAPACVDEECNRKLNYILQSVLKKFKSSAKH